MASNEFAARFCLLKVGADGRERIVSLSPLAKPKLPALKRLWSGTNKAACELEAGLSYPLSNLLQEAIAALELRPFAERLAKQDGTQKKKIGKPVLSVHTFLRVG